VDNLIVPSVVPGQCDVNTLSMKEFSMGAANSTILKISNSRTITPDGFSSSLIKTLRLGLVGLLSRLFELLFLQGFIPSDWKLSVIVPVYKSGAKQDGSTYRPIAITSICSQIMERVIKKKIFSHLLSNDVLCPNQHGFAEQKSTITILIESTLDWAYELEAGGFVDVLYIDLKKASTLLYILS